ncbi:HAMP domain-containing protein, partial [Streptomyces halstedii]|uniref:HAMP domain-containing protein n=1 Tax=Streptomyces halstedii TaxID=1944 RepID=UPI0033B58B61
PGLLAARSVLRPVRELRRAARSMGSGRLDTRIAVRGNDELADLASTFNESAAQLEDSVHELREAEARARRFASDVSHELRTPLAGMLAVTEVLDEDADRLDADTARAVRLVSAETGKLAVLVEDLMEISRFDARAAELNADEVDVAEAIRKTLQNRRWHEDDRVRTELPAGIRARLDPRRFDVVIANLVGNALRRTPCRPARLHGARPLRTDRPGAADTQRQGRPARPARTGDRARERPGHRAQSRRGDDRRDLGRRPVLGTVDTINALNRGQIARFYKKHYDPTHLVVAVAGNVDHATVVRQVRKAFEKAGALSRTDAVPMAPREGSRTLPAVRRVR